MFDFLKRKKAMKEPTTPENPLVIDCSVRGDVNLGDKVKDKLTGFTGIVNALSFELDGTVFVGIQPQELDNGKPAEGMDFDIERIEVLEPGAVKVVDGSSAKETIKLGAIYEDRTSGFKGAAVSVVLFFGGCARVTLRGKVDKDNKRPDPVMIPVESAVLVDAKPAEAAEKAKTKTGGPGRHEAPMLKRMAARSA